MKINCKAPNGWLRPILTAFVLALFTAPLQAHEARPVSVELTETAPHQFAVSMKIPNVLPENGLPQLAMPSHCVGKNTTKMRRGKSSYVLTASYHCPQGLTEQTLSLAFPGDQASTNTLFRLHLLSGEAFSHLLSPTERTWRIPAEETAIAVARNYTQLGIKHIFGGVDHLLFIACLMFIAATTKRILITITGFTLAHSLTLFLSALGIVNIAVVPVEALIALSVLFLAHEIATPNKQSWTWRYPITVSSSFGLLHGFGFASVLKEIGLPQTELITALLFFNVGVELGQVLFIAALLVAAKLWPFSLQGTLARNTGVYIIGSVAGYWFIARLLAL